MSALARRVADLEGAARRCLASELARFYGLDPDELLAEFERFELEVAAVGWPAAMARLALELDTTVAELERSAAEAEVARREGRPVESVMPRLGGAPCPA